MFETLRQFDRALLLKINSQHSPLMDSVMWTLSQSWHTYLLVIVCGYLVFKKYSPKKAAEFILGCALVVACCDLSSNITKHSLKRYRPTHNTEIKNQIHTVNNHEGGKFGFFSAHAANTFGLATFIFLCIHWVNKRIRYLFFIYPALVSYSRMYLGVHYPSDIFAGMLVGCLFGYLIYLIVNTYFLKFNAENV
ncbi:MAG: phosphatase PAP2 family protein [Bacteroidia bacterium]|nr:phosphatase PAP2 family protein [Bacteroidia bacterium]